MSFNLAELNKLYEDADEIHDMSGVKNMDIVIEYINQHIYSIANGDYYVKKYDDNMNFIYKCYSKSEIKKEIFCKVPKQIDYWFFRQNTRLYDAINDTNKPKITNKTFNLFEGFKHQKKIYNCYNNDIKEKVDQINDYFLRVICSDNKNKFDYFIMWNAAVAQGKFTEVVLYLKGPKDIGQKSYIDFFSKYVVGDKISFNCDNNEITGLRYNMIFFGKLFVALNYYGKQRHPLLQSMHIQKYTWYEFDRRRFYEQNYSNFVISTDNDILEYDNGFVVNVSTIHKHDDAYFNKLRDCCFNDYVGDAYYNYLLSINLENWIAKY